jgi:hypothetical protein
MAASTCCLSSRGLSLSSTVRSKLRRWIWNTPHGSCAGTGLTTLPQDETGSSPNCLNCTPLYS